jgi:hypothetical protein
MAEKRAEHSRAVGAAGQQMPDHGAAVLPAQVAAQESPEPGRPRMRLVEGSLAPSGHFAPPDQRWLARIPRPRRTLDQSKCA